MHPVVGALGQADALERRPDPAVRLGLAARGGDAQVLAAGQVPVEARLLDDRTDPGQRLGALLPAPACPSSRISPAVAGVRPSSTRISVVLPAPFGPRNPNAHAGRDAQVGAVQRDPVAEPLGQAGGLDGRGGGLRICLGHPLPSVPSTAGGPAGTPQSGSNPASSSSCSS